MSTRPTAHEDRRLRAGAALTALILFVSAGLAIDLAAGHMARAGVICGAGVITHCVWCFSAAGLVLAGLAAVLYAVRPRRVFERSVCS